IASALIGVARIAPLLLASVLLAPVLLAPVLLAPVLLAPVLLDPLLLDLVLSPLRTEATLSHGQVSTLRHLEDAVRGSNVRHGGLPNAPAQGNARRAGAENAVLDSPPRVRDCVVDRGPLRWPGRGRGCGAATGAPSDGGAQADHRRVGGDEERPPRALLSPDGRRPRLSAVGDRAARRPLRRARHDPRSQEGVTMSAWGRAGLRRLFRLPLRSR